MVYVQQLLNTEAPSTMAHGDVHSPHLAVRLHKWRWGWPNVLFNVAIALHEAKTLFEGMEQPTTDKSKVILDSSGNLNR
jgi:hypothetical protein